ncbi:MFS transporter [Kitasatospora sp. NPDC054939]
MSGRALAQRVRRSRERAVGGLPTAFWWLWSSTLVNRLGTFAVPFLTLCLTVEHGRSPAFAGAVAAVAAAGGMAGALLGGLAADRFGCRPTLLTAHLGTAAATTALALAPGERPLIAAALLLGCSAAAARPASAALMTALLDPRDRVRAFALDYWAANLGFSASVLLAGAAVRFGYTPLFLADAAATLLCAALVLLRVPAAGPDPGPATAGPTARTGSRGGLRELLADRPFLCCAALFVLIAGILQQLTTTLPVAMADAGLGPAACGAVLALNGVLVCLAQVPVGGLVAGRPPFALLALAALLCGTGFGLTALAGSAAGFALTVVVWTAGEVVSGPVSLEVTARFAPARSQARYQGAGAFAWSVGGVLAAAVGGWTYDRWGGGTLWTGCAAAGLAAAAGFLLLGRRVAP